MMRRFAGTTAALLVLWSMGGLIQGTAAAETTDLTLVRSAIALGPAADGSPVEVKTFYKDEKIRFYTKLSFDSTRGSAGPHRLVYKWYTGDVVSHTFGGEKRFDVSPTEWWAYLSVSQMGPGAHRAELYLDDRLFASGEFSIKAGARPFEPEEDTEVKDAVFALLVAGDTQQFDQLAARYRTSQERTTSGTWKLSLLYNAVDPNSFAPKDPRWQALRDMSDAWLARQPDSATAVALNARILYVHAWAWRAERALHAMPAEDRAQYEQLIERARSVLDQHAAVALQDPEWDTLRISIANQQGADSDEILAMADRALQRWPYFYAIHNAAVNALLPRSGGSRQAIQKYTELALERSPAEGTQAYARIYYYIARTATHQAFDELNRTGEKYQRFHESITQILRSYPSPFNQDIARNFAGLAGDVVAYREYGRGATDAMIPVAWWDTSQRRDWFNRWGFENDHSRNYSPRRIFRSYFSFLSGLGPEFWNPIRWAVLAVLLLVESSFRLLDWWARRARRNEIPAQLQRSTLNLFDYPRTYYVLPLGQASPRIGLWMFVFSSAAAYGMWQAAWPDPQEQGVVFGAFIAIATVGACILLNVLTSRLILRADEIEWRRLMDGRRIHRGDILGVRGLTNGPAYVVALRDEDAQTLYVPRVLRDDEAFRRWFESLPVLAPIEDDDEEEEELGSAR